MWAIDGVWRSWLARRVWDAEALGSSPSTPTRRNFLVFSSVAYGSRICKSTTFSVSTVKFKNSMRQIRSFAIGPAASSLEPAVFDKFKN